MWRARLAKTAVVRGAAAAHDRAAHPAGPSYLKARAGLCWCVFLCRQGVLREPDTGRAAHAARGALARHIAPP